MLDDPVQYSLVISHMIEKENNINHKGILKIDNNEQESIAKKQLKTLIKHTYDENAMKYSDSEQEKKDKIQTTLKSIDCFTVYPLLFTSLLETLVK